MYWVPKGNILPQVLDEKNENKASRTVGHIICNWTPATIDYLQYGIRTTEWHQSGHDGLNDPGPLRYLGTVLPIII